MPKIDAVMEIQFFNASCMKREGDSEVFLGVIDFVLKQV